MKKLLFGIIAALTASLALAQGQSINLYNWSNYIPPELLKTFEKETGIRVNLDVYDSNESLLAKLKAGATGYDVIVPSDYMVKIMIDEGLLEKIDTYKMPNFKNVADFSIKPPFDPKREYSAPYMWGVTGFTYDSARVPGGKLEDSWKSFFEPPAALKGQIVALNDPNDMYSAAAYYLGYDQCTEDPKQAEKILEVLQKQKPFLAAYNSDGTIERMQAKEVIMHHQWNGAAHRTKEKLKTAVFVYPKEGLPFWNDNFAVPKGAKNKEGAVKFINWMMDPKNIAVASNFTGYNNSIKGSSAYFDAALKSDPAVNTPANLTSRFRPNKICSQKATDLRDKVWTRLKR
ncbi:MAG: spermidine/putrescine ABC transporter substrate-binding protein [Meiothermus sp.]